MQRIPELPYIFTLNCPSYRFYIVSSSIFNKHITLESAYNYTVLWIQIHKTHAFHLIQLDVHNTYIELQLFFLVAVFFLSQCIWIWSMCTYETNRATSITGVPCVKKDNLKSDSQFTSCLCVDLWCHAPATHGEAVTSALVFWNMYTTELHVLCTMQ